MDVLVFFLVCPTEQGEDLVEMALCYFGLLELLYARMAPGPVDG